MTATRLLADNFLNGVGNGEDNVEGGVRFMNRYRCGGGCVVVAATLAGCASPKPAPMAPLPPRPTVRAMPPPVRAEPAPQVVSPRRRPPASATVLESWFPGNGRISPRWTTIVIHHSATDRGSAPTFDKFHRQKGWDELGYHFVIGNGTETADGAIEVGTRWHSQKHGAHCKTPDNYFNEHGIGVCLVGDFTRQGPSRRQMESLHRLVRFLSYQCGIPPDRVTTHHAINRKTACPGSLFSIGVFRRSLTASASAASVR